MRSEVNQYQQAVIAVNRFGLGARSNELEQAAINPKGWLLKQMVSPQFNTPLINSQLVNTELAFKQFSAHRANRVMRNKMQNDMAASSMSGIKSGAAKTGGMTNYAKQMRQTQKQLLVDSLWQSVETSQPFNIRLLDFFSNHFSVSSSTVQLNVLAPLLEREAIAPHLFGRFEHMLIAVVKHPAMLLYLDNAQSTGPNSTVGRRSKARRINKGRGLNENLAREILELHTLGIDGGYRIGDIQTLAKAISGWSVSHPKDVKQKGFVYRENMHEPGTRRLLGKNYKERRSTQQGERILKDLARHPSTARFVSYKLAQYLISDKPSDELVDAMSDTWQKTNGDLHAVITALVKHDDSWQLERQKFKTPREFVVSALRALEANPNKPKSFFNGIIYHLNEMGQSPFNAGSPAGYSANAEAWTGSDALMKRIDWVNRLNVVTPKLNGTVLALSQQLFADNVSEPTLLAIKRAETARQARTLLFLSPEFQRR